MLDVDLDSIFEELEDQGTRELKFMGLLASVLPSVYFQLHMDGGRICCPPGQDSPRAVPAEALATRARRQGSVGHGQELMGLCPVAVDELDAVLVFWLPEVLAGVGGEPVVMESMRAAVDLVRARMAVDEMQIENEQLTKQIGVLNTQHFEMVENNHRQYVLIQEKDRDYAKNLEAEIAQRTVELRRANEELKEASRLKSEFLANMSHELRTPLNAIIGFSDLLCESSLAPEQAEYARTIKQSGDGLLSLISDILDFSKIEAGRLDIAQESFCLPDIIRNVAAMFMKSAKDKGVAFRYEIGPDVPGELIGDGFRLKQVLINLAANAMKFTKEGEIAIAVDLIGDRIAPKVRFLVSDTGIGVPYDKQAAIFEKFTQADGSITRNYGGTGLGLTITCQLVSLMGGNVSLCSEVNRGSIFGFTIPFQVAKPSMVQPVATITPPSATGAGLRILLVEDNVVNQKLATMLIKREGCEVALAGDGLKAIETLKEQAFDLILMDLQMPNMDGMEATRRIRALEGGESRLEYQGLRDRVRPIPIIGLSAHARKEDADEAMRVGMDDFLTKPIVKAKLVDVIARVKGLDQGRSVEESKRLQGTPSALSEVCSHTEV